MKGIKEVEFMVVKRAEGMFHVAIKTVHGELVAVSRHPLSRNRAYGLIRSIRDGESPPKVFGKFAFSATFQ